VVLERYSIVKAQISTFSCIIFPTMLLAGFSIQNAFCHHWWGG